MVKKVIRVFVYVYLIFMLALMASWSIWHIMANGKMIPEPISKGIIAFAEFPSHIYHMLVPTSVAYNIFDTRQITDTTSQDGIKLFTDSSNLSSTNLLISTFLSSSEIELKLIRIPDEKLIKKWEVPTIEVGSFLNKINNTARPYHPLMTIDSSIIIKNPEQKELISLSKNKKINWVNNDLVFHHSTEQENDSTIWIPSIAENPSHYKIPGFRHDAICAIDPRNGKVKYIKSVADILIENGYKSLLDLGYEDDGIHLNDIQPALYSSKYWEKGDLLISMRHRNTVALYRPSTNKIIWLKTGPWLAQHDCDFVDEKTIMIFGNDILRGKRDSLINGHNDIYFYDFEKGEISKPYTKVMKQLGIKTKSEGRCDLLLNGDLFIDESNNGKLYIINKDSVKMIYTERFDKNHIKMFNWVRPILN
jgi:hypothetical protein